MASTSIALVVVVVVGATVLTTLLSVVSLIGLGCSVLSPTLLLMRVLPIVDPDCYSDVVIKTIGPIDLIQLVLDLFFKAVVEQLYEALVSELRP